MFRAHGEAQKTLGKGFAECYTRQMALGEQRLGKAVFAECSLPSAKSTLGNEFSKKYKKTAAAAFPRAARDGSRARPAR